MTTAVSQIFKPLNIIPHKSTQVQIRCGLKQTNKQGKGYKTTAKTTICLLQTAVSLYISPINSHKITPVFSVFITTFQDTFSNFKENVVFWTRGVVYH